jgi:hypothetical protein
MAGHLLELARGAPLAMPGGDAGLVIDPPAAPLVSAAPDPQPDHQAPPHDLERERVGCLDQELQPDPQIKGEES